jgi:hypothetical protein
MASAWDWRSVPSGLRVVKLLPGDIADPDGYVVEIVYGMER